MKIKKIKVVKDDDISILGCVRDELKHKIGIRNYETKLIIEKINEIIDYLKEKK